MSLSQFVANAKNRGFAKQNRFMVIFDPPRGQSQSLLGGALNKLVNYYVPTNNGRYIAGLYTESAALPGLNIDTKLHKTYGPGREIPYGRSYSAMNMTFYVDNSMVVKEFFDDWQNMIFDKNTGHMNFYNEYICNIHILQLDQRDGAFDLPGGVFGDIAAEGAITSRYQATLVEAYPKTVADLSLNHAGSDIHKLTVSFEYRLWENTTQLFGVGNVGSSSILDNVYALGADSSRLGSITTGVRSAVENVSDIGNQIANRFR